MVTPFQSLTRMSGDQFSLMTSAPSPSSVGFAASRAAQSDTRPGLFAGLGTANPLEHCAVSLSGRHSAERQPDQRYLIAAQRLAEGFGDAACELIAAEAQLYKISEVAQLRGYGTRQLVVLEPQSIEIGNVAHLRRYRARKLIAGEIQTHQIGKVAQLWGYWPR